MVILFSGLTGTGKSTLSEAVGRWLGIPVFAHDRISAAIKSCGLEQYYDRDIVAARRPGFEVLKLLTKRQLQLGQSAIVDSLAPLAAQRQEYIDIACEYDQPFFGISCVCSDEGLHRTRLENRRRDIPGWGERGWDHVLRIRASFEPWDVEHLTVDAVDLVDTNVQKVLAFVQSSARRRSSNPLGMTGRAEEM